MLALNQKLEMEDKTPLIEAIENYDIFTPHERKVLTTLLAISVEGVAVIDIVKLSKLSKVSRPVVYKALAAATRHGLIEKIEHERKVLNIFKLKMNKLEEIQKHYESQKLLYNTLKIPK